MSQLQFGFILATLLFPLLLWMVTWGMRQEQQQGMLAMVNRSFAWTFAIILLGAYLWAFALQFVGVRTSVDAPLPMQLCDWATAAVTIALLKRSQAAFEVAYCWGLAGTFQALLTPAIDVNSPHENLIRVWCFLILHSAIPAAVIWLMLAQKRRPSAGAWRRVAFWSQLYFGCAIVANWFSGRNYGFLARRPERPSLLDHFPDPAGGWGYMLSINAFGMLLFALMLAPWRMWKRHNTRE